MGNDLVTFAAVSAAVVLVLLVAELLKRRARVPTELTRKLAHTALGLLAAFAPALFEGVWLPALAGAALVALLVVTGRLGLLRSVHGVARCSYGAVAFPLAGLALLVVTGGRGPLFLVPLLVVALADTAAALVGRPFGKTRFLVGDGYKSVEGSLAFAAVAFLTALAVLAQDGMPLLPALGLAALLALCTALVEALSVRGLDNALVPAAAYAVLLALSPGAPHASVAGSVLLVLVVVALVVLDESVQREVHA